MKKILLTVFMLLLSAGWVVAQSSDQSSSSAQSSNGQATSSSQSGTTGSSASSQSGNAASQAPDTTGKSTSKDNKSHELRGCITEVNGDYLFTTVHGRRFVLQGNQRLIAKHLGQAVEINGGVWRTTGTTSTTDPLEASDGSASSRSLTVKNITKIEGKCTPDYH